MPNLWFQRGTVPASTAWTDLGAGSTAGGTPTALELGTLFGVGYYRFWEIDVPGGATPDEIQIAATNTYSIV
jgi:hypothetical protein